LLTGTLLLAQAIRVRQARKAEDQRAQQVRGPGGAGHVAGLACGSISP